MNTNKYDSKQWNVSDFERYYAGKMPAEEMHALEKATLEDPFLDDALEGYAIASQPVKDLRLLKQRLHEKDHKKARIIWYHRKAVQQLLRVAAVLILLGSLAWWLFPGNEERTAVELAVNKKPNAQLPSGTLPPAPVPPAQQNGNTPAQQHDETTVQPAESTQEKAITSAKKDLPAATEQMQAQMHEQSAANDEDFARTQNVSKPVAKAAVPRLQEKDAAVTLQGKVAGVQVQADKAKQQHVVKGRVVDASGNAVPYAVVSVPSSNNNAAADANGQFQLNNLPANNVTVNVNAVGYEAKNAAVNTGTADNKIVLQQKEESLSEVVVVGYGTQRKRVTAATTAATPVVVAGRRLQLTNAVPDDGWEAFERNVNELIKKQPRFDTTGNVVVRFDLNQAGKATNISVQQSLCAACDAEAANMLQQFPSLKKIKKNKKATAIFSF